jgi:hypothetical protein
MADFPEDHTPYSYTGWPTDNPYPYVFATDVMHRPDLGVDCDVLFAYWLSEAKAGRMPWLKYLIYKAKLYHVRNNWEPVKNSGHEGHIHGSARTDHLNTGLGDWSVTPTGPPTVEDEMAVPWFSVGPSGTVYLVPGDLVDSRLVFIPQTGSQLAKIDMMKANGVKQLPSTIEPRNPHAYVVAADTNWPPPEPPIEVDLSDEDIERFAAEMAEALAAAARTDAEIVALVKEGANQAEDG